MADEIVITQRHCKCCGKDWFPSKPGEPIRCPRCNSKRWNIGKMTDGERGKLIKEAKARKRDAVLVNLG